MELKERSYSVLAVSSAKNMNAALSSLLAEPHYHDVMIKSNISTAKRAWSEREYDCLIINSPLPDDPGIRFAIDASVSRGSAVLLLVRSELYPAVFDKVVRHGVFVLPKPLSRPTLITALRWMESAVERARKFENKKQSVEQKMEEIRLVNRAKWLLISELKMEEPQAHRYIEKQAMDRCISKKEVSEEIIRVYT